MEPVRVGVVRYLNTAPLNFGLEKLGGLALVPAVPSKMIDLIAAGEVEIGLASVIDAARSRAGAAPMTLLPVGMIGCDGATLTVRLFSKVPMERVAVLHADTDSHTSVVLCRVLLDALYGVRPDVMEFDAGAGVPAGGAWPESLLLIGDKVVTEAPPASLYPHQLDLGEAWKRWTGLPFVYAMWMCPDAIAGLERVRMASAVLDRQLRHNMTRLGAIAEARCREHGWPADLAAEYLGVLLRYRVGERERAAVERFVSAAAGLGLVGPATLAWGASAG